MSSVPDLISSSVVPGMTQSTDVPDNGGNFNSNITGNIYPLKPPTKSLPVILLRELTNLLQVKESKKILLFTILNIFATIVLLFWSHSCKSMALTAYTYLTVFDIFSLLICLLSVWVQTQEPTSAFSFGYGRFEVLAVFASTMLAQLGALFVIKESFERMMLPLEIHTGRLFLGTVVAFVLHMLVTYCVNNRALNHVADASTSSWLQEHMTDMSESLCHVVPGLSKLLLPRLNPFSLIAFAGAVALSGTYILIDTKNYYSADTFAAVSIAVMTLGTMFPMCVYTGKILLQTTPSHIIGQLDKLLREASTLDGVLEFRHEQFWTLSFGTLVGSVQVRVRRDADEQLVLAHVYNRLSNLVSMLTIQIFKDDWSRGTFHTHISPGFASQSLSGSYPRPPHPLEGGHSPRPPHPLEGGHSPRPPHPLEGGRGPTAIPLSGYKSSPTHPVVGMNTPDNVTGASRLMTSPPSKTLPNISHQELAPNVTMAPGSYSTFTGPTVSPTWNSNVQSFGQR